MHIVSRLRVNQYPCRFNRKPPVINRNRLRCLLDPRKNHVSCQVCLSRRELHPNLCSADIEILCRYHRRIPPAPMPTRRLRLGSTNHHPAHHRAERRSPSSKPNPHQDSSNAQLPYKTLLSPKQLHKYLRLPTW